MPAAPDDVLPVIWEKVTDGTPVLALAERPDLPGEWTLVCALGLARLADLCTGSVGLWSDLDHPERVDGPGLRIVFQPEPGSALARRWAEEHPDEGYGSAAWPYAVPIDLTAAARRDAVASLIEDERLRITWIDLADAEVVVRHEVALTEINLQTLARVLAAAEERWPAADELI